MFTPLIVQKYRDTNFFFEIGRNDVKGIWYFWVYVAASRAQATQFCFRIKVLRLFF